MRNLAGIAAALLLLGTTAATAQRNDNDRDRGGFQQNRDNDRNDRGRGDYRYQNESNDRDHFRDAPHWSRGDHLPPAYRRNDYVVSDWRARHLRQPPRGYHWVRADDRYVLASVAGGLIAEIIMNSQR
jgi:Ni/Co efflux regulator RcnB